MGNHMSKHLTDFLYQFTFFCIIHSHCQLIIPIELVLVKSILVIA